MNKEQMIEQEAKEKYPIHFSNNDSEENFQVKLRREAYKAGRLKTIEEKDKEIEKLYAQRDALLNSKKIYQENDERKNRRIKELEDALSSAIKMLSTLPNEL